MGLTPQQQQAVIASSSVSITAGAGTGKTYMLAARYLYHLQQDNLSPLEVVAMTFTDKAATELRARIRQAIADQYPERFDWLAEVEAAQISTFHAVASRICQEHPEAAGIPAHFQLLEEWQAQIWQQEKLLLALAEMPLELYGHLSFSTLKQAIAALLKDPLSAELALQQKHDAWQGDFHQKQQQIAKKMPTSDIWQESKAIMQRYQGDPGDKLEQKRQSLLALIDDFETQCHDVQSQTFQQTLAALQQFTVGNVGSGKKWASEDTMKALKQTAIAFKDFCKESQDINFLRLSIGELDLQAAEQVFVIKQAFQWVWQWLSDRKRQERILDFNDLEIYALKALQNQAVRDYYQTRWRAYLIDEFQDTNPTQGQLLAALTENAKLTIVGDDKQSIYGFRRADVKVFQTWRSQLPEKINLTTSFRTHASLIQQLNTLFKPVLGETLHQDLTAHRREQPHTNPHLEIYTFTKPQELSITAARKIEAQQIAQLIQQMLSQQMTIWDKQTHQLRVIAPQDIAILSRTWDPLDIYSQALAQWQIPFLQSDGGDLLQTREALDALSLLQFIVNPNDDLALVALLRSPLFTISDRRLYALRPIDKTATWWHRLQQSEQPEIQRVVDCLQHLLKHRRKFSPSRLLQLGDRLTGYSAVIANLPQATRRLANWQAVLDLVRQQEQGNADVLSVVRQLRRLRRYGVEVPSPPLAAANAVSLMTIHAAKGLEWSVVIVPDLTRKLNQNQATLLFDPDLGVAIKQTDTQGKSQQSVLFQLLAMQQKERETAEAKRILYVACTRARDRLILTTPATKGGSFDLLQPGLDTFTIQTINPDIQSPNNPAIKTALTTPQQSPKLLLHPVQSNGLELPMTALTTYARCPQQFYFAYIEGNPGLTEGEAQYGRAIGSLTHLALEKDFDTVEQLQPSEPLLPREKVAEAIALAQTFRTAPVFAAVQQGQKEVPLQLIDHNLILNGRADLVGTDFVLDVKTDRTENPHEYRFQLWAYAQAAQKAIAYLAYLRHQTLHCFTQADLASIGQEAKGLMQQLSQGHYAPKPDIKHCCYCPYTEICDSPIRGDHQ